MVYQNKLKQLLKINYFRNSNVVFNKITVVKVKLNNKKIFKTMHSLRFYSEKFQTWY